MFLLRFQAYISFLMEHLMVHQFSDGISDGTTVFEHFKFSFPQTTRDDKRSEIDVGRSAVWLYVRPTRVYPPAAATFNRVCKSGCLRPFHLVATSIWSSFIVFCWSWCQRQIPNHSNHCEFLDSRGQRYVLAKGKTGKLFWVVSRDYYSYNKADQRPILARSLRCSKINATMQSS